jgi:predicted ATP-binding protein involved in virulence
MYNVSLEVAMRIDHLEIENFKGFAKQRFDLHPRFTLLAGDNGSGKTNMLDALAVAAAIWLVEPPDSTLANSGRTILPSEIRLESRLKGDRVQFQEMRPVIVRATGSIDGHDVEWSRQLHGKKTSNADAKDAMEYIGEVFARDLAGENVLCPVLAYYGAGRAWLPSNQRVPRPKANGPARRWAAFYDCFNERIRFAELQSWFSREAIERGNRGGRWRPGFAVVRRAILGCVPGADNAWFDTDRNQIVLSISGEPQPFDNLSAGHRMMLALVADLAIKAVTQNAFLLPPDELGPEDRQLPRVLEQTPGVVLIDELDVHLHPSWQRRVATDLKNTFPGVQFVCTSHSPQVIGEVKPEEIRLLDGGEVTQPKRSYGIDSSRILEEVMGTEARNESVSKYLQELFRLIDNEDFEGARSRLSVVEGELGPDDPEVTRAHALMSFLESKA